MWGSQEKICGPKVNVNFFLVDPYMLGNRASRTFLIWPIWQIWFLLGKKTSFSVVNQIWKSNMDSFWTISGSGLRNRSKSASVGHGKCTKLPVFFTEFWVKNFESF